MTVERPYVEPETWNRFWEAANRLIEEVDMLEEQEKGRDTFEEGFVTKDDFYYVYPQLKRRRGRIRLVLGVDEADTVHDIKSRYGRYVSHEEKVRVALANFVDNVLRLRGLAAKAAAE